MRSVYGTRFPVSCLRRRWLSTRSSRLLDPSLIVADALRVAGRDRVVYGTDRDAIPLALYLDEIREAQPMTDEELSDLLDDPAPYLEPRMVKW